MTHTIAIVEDEPAIRDNYAEALRKHGFAVQAYASRPEARAAFAAKLPDLVMIDVGLGDELEGGYELCRELRSRSGSLPILFLTARDSELDVISGLRLGADDYLSKSVSLPQIGMFLGNSDTRQLLSAIGAGFGDHPARPAA